MSIIKRGISFVVTLALIFVSSGVTTAFAAASGTAETSSLTADAGAGQVRAAFLQTFDGLAANTAPSGMTVSGLTDSYENATLTPEELEAARGITTTSGEKGVFGKPSFDTAFMIRSKWNGTALPSGVSTAPSLEYTFPADAKTAMAASEYFHMSFDYAVDGDYTSSVRGWFQDRWSNPADSTTGSGNYAGTGQFLSSTSAGAASLFGNPVFTAMPKQKWVHFDLSLIHI